MRLVPPAAAIVLALGLACSGELLPDPEGAAPDEPVVALPATEPPAAVEPAAATPKEPETAEERKEAAKALVKAGYTANVYGVCKKYQDCKCNLYESVDGCVREFGEANDVFPPEVWSCVLARDCEGLCDFNAGTCFELYALQVKEGMKKVGEGVDCPEGQKPVEIYDLHGDLVRTECRE